MCRCKSSAGNIIYTYNFTTIFIKTVFGRLKLINLDREPHSVIEKTTFYVNNSPHKINKA